MIKARPVAGDQDVGTQFINRLVPFVWRKYLDFAAIEDIHSIKRQINAHKGHHEIAVAGHDIKVGRGGIREIEFYAQTQQLIWGGKEPGLRPGATCQALQALAEAGHANPSVVEDLTAAYTYLRRLEHRLQMVADEQTHLLPKEAGGLAAIANALDRWPLVGWLDGKTFVFAGFGGRALFWLPYCCDLAVEALRSGSNAEIPERLRAGRFLES